MIRCLKYTILILFFVSCQPEHEVKKDVNFLFTEIEQQHSEVDFINQISNSKDFNIFSYRNYYNGGGVGIGDINNDGLSDVFFTSNLGANKLYLNKGDFKFEDISSNAGIELKDKWSTGVTMVDINADGFLDIYICNAGYQKGSDQKNALFINQGNETFVDESEKYQLGLNDYSTHAAFFDYDLDGDLDLYLLNNSFIPVNTLNYTNRRELRAEDWPVADFLKGGGDKLLQNDNGVFTDVSKSANILGSLIGFGLGVSLADLNGDGYPDIYISNDFFERDYMYINQGDGTFSEELEKRIKHLSHSSMGSDIADINNDGLSEIFVTDMLPDDEYRLKTTSTFDNINLRNLKIGNGFYNQFMHNTLQLNNGDGNFSEIAFYAGVAASDWSWGALFMDADNDGNKDLFVSNGILNDVIDQDFIDFFANEIIQDMVLTGTKQNVDSVINKMPSVPLKNKLFINNGDLTFSDEVSSSGFTKASFSNGAAYGDLDNDGDLDLVVNNVNMTAQIFKNNSVNTFLSMRLKYQGDNINGIGTKLSIYTNDQTYFQEFYPARGFQSSVDYKMIQGLNNSIQVDSILVEWPNGKIQKLNQQSPNQLITIEYDESKIINQVVQEHRDPLFEKTNHNFVKHQEDSYIDFLYERNIPVQLSKEGPCVAVGDFNGDGKDDVYIGGGTDQSPVLYKNVNGSFVQQQQEYFDRFKAFEDTEAVFFDCDMDGDLDLYVGSGGNNVTYDKRAFRDRLYINTDGVFEISFNAIPKVSLNTSKVLPFDIEGDGDLDLFVGMRSIPGEYGLSPGSNIYLNNGRGQFRDITKAVVPELTLAGMITDAVLADVLPNEGKELILVGEWMSPKILSFNGEKFDIVDSNLSEYAGMWQSVVADDINKDGHQDLLIGNIGENFSLKANEENPVFLFVNDFNQDGSFQKIMVKRKEGKDYPVMVKRDLIDQFPSLKKENLMHAEFANKSIQDLFEKDLLGRSVIKKMDYQASVIALNDGTGNFNIGKMGPEIQLSCINAMTLIDINNDGYRDVIVGGNNDQFLPQFSSIDACMGKVLINNKKGGYNLVSNKLSGLHVDGVVRDMELLTFSNNIYVLFGINDEIPQLYKLNDRN